MEEAKLPVKAYIKIEKRKGPIRLKMTAFEEGTRSVITDHSHLVIYMSEHY